MRRLIFLSVLTITVCVANYGIAFDNHRQGFIIGGLGGVAYNILQYEHDGEDESYRGLGYQIDLRIGGGTQNNKFMFYSWVKINFSYPWLLYTGAIGLSYYLKPDAPSLYFNIGVGISGVAVPILMGPGVIAGIGYEFFPHMSFETGIYYVGPKIYEVLFNTGEYDFNSLAMSLSIVVIAY